MAPPQKRSSVVFMVMLVILVVFAVCLVLGAVVCAGCAVLLWYLIKHFKVPHF
jgi:hypothetical protein